MKTLTLICCVLTAVVPTVHGQSGNQPDKDQGGENEKAPDLGKERDGMRKAKDLGKAGDVAAVEQEVATLNRAKKNTAEWHLETAQRLVQTAEELAREGQSAEVEKLVRQALRQLEQAQKKAKDGPGRAAASLLAGFIHERYLADAAAALKAYDEAAQEAPDETPAAAEAAKRLRKTKDNLTRKAGHGRG